MKTGMCKFGGSCKYHHPRPGGGPPNSAAINFYGFPLRPGEKECSYYMKTGQCKFGVTCKFHHPHPAGIQMATPAAGHLSAQAAAPAPLIYQSMQSSPVQSTPQYGLVAGNWSVGPPAMLPGSYLPPPFGAVVLPQGMIPVPGWGPYSASINPGASSTQAAIGEGTIYGITQLSPSSAAYAGPYLSMSSPLGSSDSTKKEPLHPDRPSQPECRHYLKTGDCKFGSSCRYHHPPELSATKTSIILGPIGLPLHMGAPVCSDYAQSGICKFGSSCKFDHPIGTLTYSPSTSSLGDVPVAPYPVTTSVGNSVMSSSSSDLRPEHVSGSNKDVFSTRMSSSRNSSTGSVGSFFPKGVSHSSVQQSEQSSAPSTSSSGNVNEDEVRTSS